MTFLAALRHELDRRAVVYRGADDGDSFRLYVEKFSCDAASGDIRDHGHLGPQKAKPCVSSSVRGSKLFLLPKYSPDLTPSNRSSPAQALAAKGCRAHVERFASPSAKFSRLSTPTNAPASSQTQVTDEP